MSLNRGKGNSSFWRRDGSSEDQQSAPSGSGWGRQPGSFNPQASGGSGWGRPPGSSNPQASGGSGWGRQPGSSNSQASGGSAARPSPQPNFQVVLIAALLLLPGVTQPIADDFTKDYVQKNQVATPYTQDDIDRAIADFNRQDPPKAPAPPEGYTAEYVSHCFHEKYDLRENLREKFEGVVQSYITKNPKPFLMKPTIAVDRALLQIYESLSKENGRPIPENANRDLGKSSDARAASQAVSQQNLFGEMIQYSKSNLPGINRQNVIDFAKHYTKNVVSQQTSESPTAIDIMHACRALFDSFFDHHSFNQFRELGICPETLSPKALTYFKSCNIVKNLTYLASPNITNKDVKRIQKALCLADPDEIGYLLGVWELTSDGRLTLWKQGRDPRANQKEFHQVDPMSIKLVSVTCFGPQEGGSPVFSNSSIISDNIGGQYYDQSNNPISWSSANASAMMNAAAVHIKSPFFPSDQSNIKSSRGTYTVSSSKKAEFFDPIMAAQGLWVIPVSISTNTEVLAQSVEDDVREDGPTIIRCHHGETVKDREQYKECKKCTSGKPGKNPIKDGWANTIGYLSP